MKEDEYLKGVDLIRNMGGMIPKGCKKPIEEITIEDYVKELRGNIGDRTTYGRIPIRRRTPENILTHKAIADADDLELRIKLMVDWYKDMMPDYNIVIDFTFQALTDEEMDAMLEDEGTTGVLHEISPDGVVPPPYKIGNSNNIYIETAEDRATKKAREEAENRVGLF